MRRFPFRRALLALPIAVAGCVRGAATLPAAAVSGPRVARGPAEKQPLDAARQLVLVVTPEWDSTSGTLRRFERDSVTDAWRAVGTSVPIVVGQSGVAWDDSQVRPRTGEPVKREGDGRSPAGAFALDTAFGFDSQGIVSWVRLPYVQLRESTECVDDVRSAHYNTMVDRDRISRVDWTSSERMRRIEQYAYGVHVAYNAPSRPSRGSCIFLHIWAGPGTFTAGCTAMDLGALRELMAWIDPQRRPMLVQLPLAAAERMRGEWKIP